MMLSTHIICSLYVNYFVQEIDVLLLLLKKIHYGFLTQYIVLLSLC